MLNREEGLIISDTRNSAISISSRVWAEKLNAKIIYALEFSSLSKLLQFVDGNFSWVLFAWRGSLETILKDRLLTLRLNQISSRTILYFSVPDHVDLTIEGRVNSNPIYEYADGFTVVSRRLQDSYNSLPSKIYAPLHLPDFPNVELLEEVRRMRLTTEPNSVIWVGNSRWGENLGFRDHKGYFSILKKIQVVLKEEPLAPNFKIIDRGKTFVPHRETLIEIAKSNFLLQTSASEGTGLPVLEALALGTYPITTDVGICREIFGDQWNHFMASTPEEFVLILCSPKNVIRPEDLRRMYLIYLEQCVQIVKGFGFKRAVPHELIQRRREKYSDELRIDFKNRLKWPVRFLLNKVRTFGQNLKTGKL